MIIGSGFVSNDLYLHKYFSASIKLFADYTTGVMVAFYINHEFLGNIRGKDWRIQTNVYGNGSIDIGREERYGLWFDPTEDFHQYNILWTNSKIIVKCTYLADDDQTRHRGHTRTGRQTGARAIGSRTRTTATWDTSSQHRVFERE
ncbi:hypothetical protein JHK82_050051 [Glycine max]|nr:hypothetical protein JHK86_049925 [Glycine max]KAG4935777.1 hypothetical protein JHK85_050696 [Glycine max]KAG5091273.1 hypothetical protein JHK82_050051 [Glycine max]